MVLEKKINPKYLPKSLSKSDKEKQLKSLKNKLLAQNWILFKANGRYGSRNSKKNTTQKSPILSISINIYSHKRELIKFWIKDGARTTSGSRPNQTTESWALARLASVLLKGPAYDIDKKIAQKHGRRKWLS